MLFQSSLRKELARSFGATLVVLITIIVTIVLIRTLGLAARGQADPQDVILLMAYATLGRLPTILSLSLFIAILSTLSRLYRDSEMVVWFASGRGLGSFLLPVLRFSWPTLLVIALSALWLWPWTNEKTQELRDRYQQRSDLDRVAPGQFQESSDGSRVFFIDRDSQEKSGNDIFIAARDARSRTVVTAKAGRIEMSESGQILTLEAGQRMEIQEATVGPDGKPDKTPGLRVSQFDSYSAVIGEAKTTALDATSYKFMSTWGLMQAPSRANHGELAWRLGLTLSGLNLVLLAVAMAHANPRAGRSGRLILAIFLFLVYSNLMTLSQNWVNYGWITLVPMVLLLHGGFMAAALLWLTGRHRGWALPRIGLRARLRAVAGTAT
ncbi:MAG: LPS export ABC transporter permease LptF [Betaproteobacteria bacterium]